MSNDWIYIGADRDKLNWSKIGKTTLGLNRRHTSSQNPTYFIYNGYQIIEGDVHEIESELLNYLDFKFAYYRLNHVSTGSKSECFNINPDTMVDEVEHFLQERYSSSVSYDHVFNNIRKYECKDEYRKNFKQENKNSFDNDNDIDIDIDFNKPRKGMQMSKDDYISGNKVVHEIDLGNGYFIDLETGMEGYRYEDETVEWRDKD